MGRVQNKWHHSYPQGPYILWVGESVRQINNDLYPKVNTSALSKTQNSMQAQRKKHPTSVWFGFEERVLSKSFFMKEMLLFKENKFFYL